MSTLLKLSQKNLVHNPENSDGENCGVNSIVNSLNLGSGEELPHLDKMSKAAMSKVFSDEEEEIEAMRSSPTSALKSRVTIND